MERGIDMKYLFILAIFLIPNLAHADMEAKNREEARMQSKGESLTLAEEKQLIARGWRDRRESEIKPLMGKTFRPSDYVDDATRGTVEYMDETKNYSWHKVLIPNGSIVSNCNFGQAIPGTDAIVRDLNHGSNLTFQNCRLVNVKTYPDWTLINSNNSQVEFLGSIDSDKGIEITGSVSVSVDYNSIPKRRTRPVGVIK